jgi:Seryl-tRNA synthetase
MPIDINRIRADKGGDPEEVKNSQILRFKDPSIVDQAIELDQDWRKKSFATQQKNKELNQILKAIAEKKKSLTRH